MSGSSDPWSYRGISCHNLCKSYGNFRALADLNLKVDPGKILGLVGPNGAGKTTALRSMAAIIPVTSGEVKVDGHDVKMDPVLVKGTSSFVPDTPHLFDHLTVEEHLHFAGRIYGLEDIGPRITSLLTTFELNDQARSLPGTLSRGMKQKVAICLGFLHDPKAIFLDEPLTGLDPIGMRNMKAAIVDRAKSHQAAIIVSSHQLELIDAICDEILIIDKGRQIVTGTLEKLRAYLAANDSGLSLEELFFRIVEENRNNPTASVRDQFL
ncbi:MAG: ABC transporter ATP-binding protein [Pseudomonadales bacterium]|nr:ABC transporter ATP-binding protein [Pseudomonadales bacterium]MDP7597272.1 ABC transporter ATP-binding protein [Pseudomonadales bacterium]HJN49765.1 ABC transporter ATP-binding protein [Pseudomonadales bacterium]